VAISSKTFPQPIIGQIAQVESSASSRVKPQPGALIINADDWGRNREATDRTLDCVTLHAISSASGMVFMEDSERAASLARERRIDIGLHLNLTEAFSAQGVSVGLREHHARVARFLLRHRFSQTIYHPGVASSFEYVVNAQLQEFNRIYGEAPKRIDGHHHMHLSENVLAAKLLPRGTLVRRNFWFEPGEKSWINRRYRRFTDRRLQRRHKLVDFLFSIQPIKTERLQRVLAFAQQGVVELETHPVNPNEFEILTSKQITKLLGNASIAPNFSALVFRNYQQTVEDFKP
jgi:hypothetical protein